MLKIQLRLGIYLCYSNTTGRPLNRMKKALVFALVGAADRQCLNEKYNMNGAQHRDIYLRQSVRVAELSSRGFELRGGPRVSDRSICHAQ
jgi:hypothetical protein